MRSPRIRLPNLHQGSPDALIYAQMPMALNRTALEGRPAEQTGVNKHPCPSRQVKSGESTTQRMQNLDQCQSAEPGMAIAGPLISLSKCCEVSTTPGKHDDDSASIHIHIGPMLLPLDRASSPQD